MAALADLPISRETRAQVIGNVRRKVEEVYVFPDVAAQVSALLAERHAAGAYDGCDTVPAFIVAVTKDMQSLNNDRHLRLQPRNPAAGPMGAPPRPEQFRQARANDNFGLYKVERLCGNVGYLDIRLFDSPAFGGETAAAAMSFLGNSSALICDLRQCRGGHPDMVALILSYLFDHPVHVNSFYSREGDQTTQSWTLPYVPGRRFGGEKPVYVLTSRFTFSGGEEFAYDLQTRKRATIVGETTGGGAHPGRPFPVSDQIDLFAATGRAINPVTGTNWEGTGVSPDVAVPKEEALNTAYRMALEQIQQRLGSAETPAEKMLAAEAKKAMDGLS